jgi:hypothetical protein
MRGKIRPDLKISEVRGKEIFPVSFMKGFGKSGLRPAFFYDRPFMSSVGKARDIVGEVIIKSINTRGTSSWFQSMASAMVDGATRQRALSHVRGPGLL